ncbi:MULTISPECIES: YchJ family metal-binding protein [unclassified Aeromicrobium]|jgi:SEC-C motif-containing protein|uniref:YchJ family protein n=1 Tax=unclassified Aeromicrobium TaxID=2633570 RepID=UPI002579D5BA|nr:MULTISPECIES: YchJ family metal-binding protein [unclassified Aeromicrobium]
MARTCPCGTGAPFDDCCRPYLDGQAAPTAERLMRSRYTAYVRGDGGHLLRTWHPTTRPTRVDHDPGLEWLGLEVLRTEAGDVGDAFGVVEFRAAYLADEPGVLHEVSRFARTDEGWQYVRGRMVDDGVPTIP